MEKLVEETIDKSNSLTMSKSKYEDKSEAKITHPSRIKNIIMTKDNFPEAFEDTNEGIQNSADIKYKPFKLFFRDKINKAKTSRQTVRYTTIFLDKRKKTEY